MKQVLPRLLRPVAPFSVGTGREQEKVAVQRLTGEMCYRYTHNSLLFYVDIAKMFDIILQIHGKVIYYIYTFSPSHSFLNMHIALSLLFLVLNC